MLVFLLGAGLLLSIGTKLVQYRRMGKAFALLKDKGADEGDIPPFQSLMSAMSATIGTGNIVGVATAIAAGGPGAVFWMWLTAIVGGATKFAEAVLAMKYRITNEQGERSGGPMYYCSTGMEDRYGGNWKWLGVAFAFFGAIAAFGIGNLTQVNSIAGGLKSVFNTSPYVTGVILAVLVGIVVIGGIQRIGTVAGYLVPIMAVFYVIATLIILFANFDRLGSVFSLIFSYAFNGQAVAGGLLGAVIRNGVARGVFSNEAGLGSAPIVHAASHAKDPVKQGLIASLGCFLDTIIVCTMTALVILLSGFVGFGSDGMLTVQDGLTGGALTSEAFGSLLSGGEYIVVLGIALFAFSTIIGWYYYGYKCLEYLVGSSSGLSMVYKIIWALLSFVGSVVPLSFVWNLSDTFNGLMAIPNLIALIALSPVVFAMLGNFEKNGDEYLEEAQEK
ncbi:MAG: alanine/glycine:cation symporter family protein [Spirochaetota bacterium]